MKIAIVYDWVDKWGGVERMLQVLCETFPEAELFTSIYDSSKASWASKISVKTSFMQQLPDFVKKSRVISSQLYPYAFESFDFTRYDLVISVTSSFAKGVITKPDTKHICILLTPTRYIWDMKDEYKRSSWFSVISEPFLSDLRKWDFVAAQRPDILLGISQLVVDRCDKAYKRHADVLNPPFDSDYWSKISPESIKTSDKYYLVVSRLEPYKRVNLVIETFKNHPERQCIVVGTGSELTNLKAIAGSNIQFLSNVSDAQLAYLYSHAQALIMPQQEDFGYTALEALYFDCPVISYVHSGTAEIIQDTKTGLFFQEQTPESLHSALERFASVPYNVASYKQSILERFSKIAFIEKLKVFIAK